MKRGEFFRILDLIYKLAKRDILQRYKGSMFGVLWTFLTPLLMLSVYTFVFGAVFQAKWALPQGDGSILEFSVILFGGLIVFQLFSDVISAGPGLITSNSNYVTKLIFPVQILSIVSLCSALFHFAVSCLVLLAFILYEFHQLPLTAFLLPLVILPMLPMMVGLSWLLSSFGVYLRDLGQVVAPIITALLFLAPIFFPVSAMPDWIKDYVYLNPLTQPVNNLREVLIYGTVPDVLGIIIYTAISLTIAAIGYLSFSTLRKGFADVL